MRSPITKDISDYVCPQTLLPAPSGCPSSASFLIKKRLFHLSLPGGPPSQSRMCFGSMWVLHNCLRVSSPWLIKINPTLTKGRVSSASTNTGQSSNHTKHQSGSDIYPLGVPVTVLGEFFLLLVSDRDSHSTDGKTEAQGGCVLPQDHMNTEWQGQGFRQLYRSNSCVLPTTP